MFARRPMVGLVLCFGLGIGFGWSFHVPAFWPWVVAGAGYAVLLALFFLSGSQGSRARTAVALAFSIGLTAVGLGWVRSDQTWREGHRGDAMLRSHASGRVQAVGLVASDPVSEIRNGRPRRTFRVKLERIGEEDGTSRACAGTLHVVLHGPAVGPTVAYGQRWRWAGRLAFLPFGTEASADGKARRRSPRATGRYWLNAGPADQRFLNEARGWRSRVQASLRGRAAAAEYLSLGIAEHENAVGLLQALLLGDRARIGRADRETFYATGAWHVFAISGLHVGILVLLMAGVLRMTGLSRERWIFFLAPALAAYVWATGARPSAVRAGLMAAIYFLAPLWGRKSDPLTALALTAGLILAAAPADLFDLGFVFSFVVVAGLMAFYPLFNDWLLRRVHRDAHDYSLPEMKPKGWRGAALALREDGARALCSLAALSAAAWIASAPLTSYCFGRLTPVALIANLLAVPLVFLIVLSGALALTLGMILPILADIFNHANLALIAALTRGLNVLRAIPGGHIEGWHVPFGWLAVWYGLWLAVALWVHGARAGEPVNSR